MSIHLEFKNVRNSEAVTAHVHELFRELVQITEDRFPFHLFGEFGVGDHAAREGDATNQNG